jgi:hypothetical protein
LHPACGRTTSATPMVGRPFGGAAVGGRAGQNKFRWRRKLPLTRPATAGESAVAGHPPPKGEGKVRPPRCPAENMGNDRLLGRGPYFRLWPPHLGQDTGSQTLGSSPNARKV